MPLPRDENGRIKPGPGRPKGSANKMTEVSDAAMLAALEGGPGGAIGFWTRLRDEEPAIFARCLVARAPKDLHLTGDMTWRTILEDVAARSAARRAEVAAAVDGSPS